MITTPQLIDDGDVARIDSGLRLMPMPTLLRTLDLTNLKERFSYLTTRERAVLLLVIQGLTNKEIALRLDCSLRTVEGCRNRLQSAIGAENSCHAVLLAVAVNFPEDQPLDFVPPRSPLIPIRQDGALPRGVRRKLGGGSMVPPGLKR